MKLREMKVQNQYNARFTINVSYELINAKFVVQMRLIKGYSCGI